MVGFRRRLILKPACLFPRRDASRPQDVRTTAPPEVVDALPIRIAGDGDEETAEKLCPICQEQFAAGDAILALSNCPHLLHRECGREWLLQYSKRCPTCKASVVPADAC